MTKRIHRLPILVQQSTEDDLFGGPVNLNDLLDAAIDILLDSPLLRNKQVTPPMADWNTG